MALRVRRRLRWLAVLGVLGTLPPTLALWTMLRFTVTGFMDGPAVTSAALPFGALTQAVGATFCLLYALLRRGSTRACPSWLAAIVLGYASVYLA